MNLESLFVAKCASSMIMNDSYFKEIINFIYFVDQMMKER